MVLVAMTLVDVSPCISGMGLVRELELIAAESSPSECTGCCDARTNTEPHSACKQNVSIAADDPFTGERGCTGLERTKRNIIRRQGTLLVRRWSHPYEHTCARTMIMHEHRCTSSQTIKANISKENNEELTETISERAKRG